MDFYIIIIPVLLLSVSMLAHLLVLARRDNSFFAKLRQQREVMAQIRAMNFSLTPIEYRRLRESLFTLEPQLDSVEQTRTIPQLPSLVQNKRSLGGVLPFNRK